MVWRSEGRKVVDSFEEGQLEDGIAYFSGLISRIQGLWFATRRRT